MALPFSRNTTYVPGVTPLKGNDQNAIQDCIIGGKHGDLELVLAPFAWLPFNNIAYTHAMVPMRWVSGAAGGAVMAIPVIVGMRVKTVKWRIKGDGVVDSSGATLWIRNNVDTDVDMGGAWAGATNIAAAWSEITIDPADTTLTVAQAITLAMNFNAAGLQLGQVRVAYDHP